jgi:1-aminocyclopropane-1-carboxylate deaminase
MAAAPRLPSPLQEITDPGLGDAKFRLILKRDDLISAELPGNKWRKLTPNLEAARRGGRRTLLTFGGALLQSCAGHRRGRGTLRVRHYRRHPG